MHPYWGKTQQQQQNKTEKNTTQHNKTKHIHTHTHTLKYNTFFKCPYFILPFPTENSSKQSPNVSYFCIVGTYFVK